MHMDEAGSAPPPPFPTEAEGAPPPPPLPADAAGPTAQTESSSVNEGVIGGLVTAAAAFPLMYPAIFVAAFFARELSEMLLGRRIRYSQFYTERYDWLTTSVGGFLVGVFAAALAGTLLVKFLFRKPDPTIYFRVGAAAMLPVAIFWAARNDARFSVIVFALFVWLGSLLGLKLAIWETKAGKAAHEAANAAHDARMHEHQRRERERFAAAEASKGDGSGGGT